ncbi:MAG: prepilin peptidase, partial [Lachnospiraceae bacterium]|nr:prepilin peptidase [Lachnospiraceae bacterium]
MRLSIAEICIIFIACLMAGGRLLRWGRRRYGIEVKPAFRAVFVLAGSLACLWILEIRGMTLESVLYSLCTFVLLMIGIIDEKTFEIPVELNLFMGALGVVRLSADLACWQEYLAGMVAVSSLLLVAGLLTKGKGIGGGDIKMMAAAGLLLGAEGIVPAFFLGSLTGLLIHPLRMKLWGKSRVMALGPYLSFGI